MSAPVENVPAPRRPHGRRDMRRSQRRVVLLEAQLRTGGGLRDTGTVLDLSPSGCSVTVNTFFLSYGQRLTVRLPGLESLAGTVRWIEGQRCGIEFAYALHPAVVEHLIGQFRQNAA